MPTLLGKKFTWPAIRTLPGGSGTTCGGDGRLAPEEGVHLEERLRGGRGLDVLLARERHVERPGDRADRRIRARPEGERGHAARRRGCGAAVDVDVVGDVRGARGRREVGLRDEGSERVTQQIDLRAARLQLERGDQRVELGVHRGQDAR